MAINIMFTSTSTSLLALVMVTSYTLISLTLLSSTSALTLPSYNFHRRDNHAIKAFIARKSSSIQIHSRGSVGVDISGWSMDMEDTNGDYGAPASSSPRFSWRIPLMGKSRSSNNANKQRGGENGLAASRGARLSVSEAALLTSNNAASLPVGALDQPNRHDHPMSRVRTSVRGVRRRFITSVVTLNGVLRFGNRKQGESPTMLSIDVADNASCHQSEDVSGISHAYDLAALSSRGGESDSATATMSTTSSISSTASSCFSIDSIDTYVIETPLFPIILPKVWEPAAASSTVSSGATVTSNTLEISVATMEQDTTATDGTSVGVAEAKPSPQLLQAATQPLLSKDMIESFTGREFYYPESIEALAQTGIAMTLGSDTNKYVNWSSEKKTERFLKDHGIGGLYAGNDAAWYEALDASQEVLVWAGKAIEKTGYYGAELPIIKTTSIIHQSPKYLAELLMDSENVKVYNKMSLGRTDAKVFQTGVDTQEGSFGDGESKVVRNLTKPPMVKSLIEFVTCMHARKLRPSDMKVLSPNANINGEDEDATTSEGGYIVVSRAVTGGEWTVENPDDHVSPTGEKLVRNEILLGVNILKAVPGEPDKTELIAVTHVYSPMIPAMLAKSAGVKAAVDFVRDIRALP